MRSLLPLVDNYAATLLEAHWAVQIPAAASGVLEAARDFRHTNLLVEDGVLRGRPLKDGRRAEIDLDRLVVRVGAAELALEGRTLDHGVEWLSAELGQRVELLQHDLPTRAKDKPFERPLAGAQLQAWFDAAQRRLSELAAQHGSGEVRLWPHHFDIATLMELDPGGAEDARSVNAGLSPGDSAYAVPYWYVTPWPRPDAPLPALRVGHWHTEGFIAAVLPATQLEPDSAEAQAAVFLEQAVEICLQLVR